MAWNRPVRTRRIQTCPGMPGTMPGKMITQGKKIQAPKMFAVKKKPTVGEVRFAMKFHQAWMKADASMREMDKAVTGSAFPVEVMMMVHASLRA